MIEKNPLESYEQELESQKSILDSLNKHSEELKIEKSKMNKYEYEERYSQEEEKINQYIDKTNLEISRLEKMIDAYHNIEKLNEKLKQLDTIIPRDDQEKKELNADKKYVEELKNKNMDNLPEEIKVLFLTKNPSNIAQEEKISNEVILEDKKVKGIDDYRKEMEENEKEIKHLKENIEKLNSLKSSIPLQEYERDLATLKRYKNRENGKLLRNRQIVTAYELIENNQERISYLNSLIARDEQDAREIKEEFDFLTEEIENNKRFIPKNLYQSLITTEHKEEKEQIEYFDEDVTQEEMNSYDNEKVEKIKKENGRTVNRKQFFENKTTQEPLAQAELSEGKGPEINFSKSQDIFRRIQDLSSKNQNNPSLVSLSDTLQGTLKPEESKEAMPEVESQDNSSSKKFYGINLDDLNKSKVEVVEEEEINPVKEETIFTPDEIYSKFFEEKNDSEKTEQKEETESSTQKNENPSTSTSENPTLKEEESTTNGEENTNTSNKNNQTENSESTENKEFNQPIVVEDPLEEQSKNHETPKRKKVTRTRKPKKSIKKRIIQKIAIIATALVLISVGLNSGSSKKNNPTPASRVNTESLDNTESEMPEEDIIEIFEAPNQTHSKIGIDGLEEYLGTDASKETELISESESETLVDFNDPEYQTETGTQKVVGIPVKTSQAIPQPSPGQNTGVETLIELDDLVNPQIDTDFSETIEVTDSDALESAFMNSGIIEKKAEDEYSAAQGNWEGVKDENIQYWIDNPLRFTEDEKTGAYLMEQQDENGNWVGMGWTDGETAYQYLQNLESYENQNVKGRH